MFTALSFEDRLQQLNITKTTENKIWNPTWIQPDNIFSTKSLFVTLISVNKHGKSIAEVNKFIN